jgi:large subunit GTPase 1
VLTPFERNLELWRQLWRVMERSDIIVQIVDSRNPLLFRSADLEKYASEFDPSKRCVLLVNKADLLSKEQIEIWKKYLEEQKIEAIFWSAKFPNKPQLEDDNISDKLNRTSLSEADRLSYIDDPSVSYIVATL